MATLKVIASKVTATLDYDVTISSNDVTVKANKIKFVNTTSGTVSPKISNVVIAFGNLQVYSGNPNAVNNNTWSSPQIVTLNKTRTVSRERLTTTKALTFGFTSDNEQRSASEPISIPALASVHVYDDEGNLHDGLVTAYDANGNARQCVVSCYDANGAKRQTR